MMPRSRNILILILLAAALVRFAGLGHKQLWVDEILQVLHAQPAGLGQILQGVKEDRGGVPLDYLVQHVFLRLGPSEWAARFHAALFGTLSVAVLFGLARRWWDDGVAATAAFLYALYPFHQHYSQEARPYALFTFLVLCSYWLFTRWLDTRAGRHLVLYGAVAILSVYTQAFGVLVLASQCLLAAALWRIDRVRPPVDRRPADGRFVGGVLAAAGVAVLLYVPWLLWTFGSAKGELAEPLGPDLLVRVFKELGDGSYPLAGVLAVFAAAGLWALWQEGIRDRTALLLGWVLVPLPLIAMVLQWRDYFFATRQILFLTPALFILVALGIRQVSALRPRLHPGVLAGLVAGISLVVIALHVPDRRDDLRGAGRFLQGEVRDGDWVVAPQTAGILSYYDPAVTGHAVDWRQDAPAGIHPGDPARVFIVETRYDRASAQAALGRFLSGGWSARRVRFRGIDVYVMER